MAYEPRRFPLTWQVHRTNRGRRDHYVGDSAHGVTVCFDYALYMLTGTDPRPVGDARMQGTSAGDVQAVLQSQGYKPLARRAAGNELKAKDVIFIGTSHVGYVAGPDAI